LVALDTGTAADRGLADTCLSVLLCRSHGALATSGPEGSLEFRSTDPARVQRYCFGGRTADFLVCREARWTPLTAESF
jgi:hypothetical protein